MYRCLEVHLGLKMHVSENASGSQNASGSENASMPDITSVSENVSLLPHAHFGSPLERLLEQKHFGSPSADLSLFLDNDVLDNDISMDSKISKKMESVSCNENSPDPANDLPFKEID